MSTLLPAPAQRQESLFAEHRRRPGLLVRELLWRWGCGGLLLCVAGYEGWRIWLVSAPALRATGLLSLNPDVLGDLLVQGPAQIISEAGAAFAVVWPQVERAAAGLAPFMVFCWSLAYGWGRTAVLARWDSTLPRRPWLLAQSEALRLLGTFVGAAAWFALGSNAVVFAARGVPAHGLMDEGLLLCFTALVAFYSGRYTRTVYIASSLALLEHGSVWLNLRRAWGMDRSAVIWPLRRAVRRIRLVLLGVAVVLTFVPAPFGLGWPLVLWLVLWSLPPLAAATAWQLGAMFALLRVLRQAQPANPAPAKL